MKVLHIINNLGSGGAEKMLVDLLTRIKATLDIEVDVLLLTAKKNVYYELLRNSGINISIIKYNNMYDPRNIIAIRNKIVKGEYDVVHSHLFPTQYWVAFAKSILKGNSTNFFTTEHSTYNRRRSLTFISPLERYMYSKYDKIISVNEETEKSLKCWFGNKDSLTDRLTVIENGIDLDKIKNAKAYNKSDLIGGINENIKLLCMVGRFSEAKDQGTLIRAIKKLPDDIHLILVGEGPLISGCKALAVDLEVADRVHFLGFRNDVYEILKTSDIIILSSHWEGLSLSSIEGLASEKPFIASDVPGLREIVDGYGISFERGNVNQLVESINELLSDNMYYNSIIDRCIKRSKEFDIDNMISKITAMYLSN